MTYNEQKYKDLIYGITREEIIKSKLEKYFNLTLIHTKNQYCLFDYYDFTQTFLFEIKNYRYSIDKYEYEIIGVNKALCNSCVFVFNHEADNNRLFYIQYNKKLFNTFNKRYISYRNKHIQVFDIPKKYLTELKITEKIKTPLKKYIEEEKDFIDYLIENDIDINNLTNKNITK